MKSCTLKKQCGAVLAFSLVMLVLLTLASVSMIRQNKIQINIATNAGQQVTAFAEVETALRQTQAVLEALRYQDKASKHCLPGLPLQAVDFYRPSSDPKFTDNFIHPDPHPTGTLVGLPEGVSAIVKAEYCVSDYGIHDPNSSVYSGTESQCLYNYIDNTNGNATEPSYSRDNWVRNILKGSIVRPSCPDLADSHLPSPLCTDPPESPAPEIAAVPSQKNVDACVMLNNAGDQATGGYSSTACQVEVYTMHVSLLDSNGARRTVESKFEIDCSGNFNRLNP